MLKPSAIITEFVLDKMSDEPISRRIALTRALAQVSGDVRERRQLEEIVADLERVERKQRKLTLRFKDRNT